MLTALFPCRERKQSNIFTKNKPASANVVGHTSSVLVRITGLEPACPCEHMDLNHTRLPIPPYPHYLNIISHYLDFVKYKNKTF